MFNFGIISVGQVDQLLADRWFDSVLVTVKGDTCCYNHLGERHQFVRKNYKHPWRRV